MKKLSLRIFFCSFCLLFATNPNASAVTDTNQNRIILEVELDILAPFSTAKLSIIKSNTVNGEKVNIHYEAKSPKTGIDLIEETKEISIEEFDALAQMIQDADFWSLKKKYIDDNFMDVTYYTLSVKSVINDDKIHLRDADINSVRCSGYGNRICPEKVKQIINKIKELWGEGVLEVGV